MTTYYFYLKQLEVKRRLFFLPSDMKNGKTKIYKHHWGDSDEALRNTIEANGFGGVYRDVTVEENDSRLIHCVRFDDVVDDSVFY